ncbi:MAG: LysM domain-containing protein [Chthoniobacterales bacterium]
MKLSFPTLLSLLFCGTLICSPAGAQTFADGSEKASAQLEALNKKIDEQSLKIDALSQQLLKMEKQLANTRPGVMIGESAPSASSAPSTAAAAPAAAADANTHIVAKGETLTSIAKTHRVGVQELQKFNHIENDRALQIGQTIMIPTPGGDTTPTPSASPNE